MKKLILKSTTILSLSLGLTSNTFAQIDPNLATDLQENLDEYLINTGLTGISAAMTIPSQGTWKGVAGFSDPTTNETLSTESVFAVGSITKTFVATTLLKLEEEGVLSIDDSISQWLPQMQNIDGNITIKQLLDMTSGLNDVTETTTFEDSVYNDLTRFWNPQEVLAWTELPEFAPGTDYEYCNTNYILLGMIIEQATQSTVVAELNNRFFTPYNLTETSLEPYEAPKGILADSWADIDNDGNLDNISGFPRTSLHSSIFTSGAIYSTASDVAEWTQSLYSGEILSQNSMIKMLTPNQGSYGLGTISLDVGGTYIFGHDGEVDGFTSLTFYFPLADVSITVLSNETIDDDPINALIPLMGIFLETYEDFVTDVEEPINNTVPTNFALEQNFPNPFNPKTVISYQLPANSVGKLVIFNVLGEKIKSFELAKNRSSVVWDGTDFRGNSVSSGTYFYRLQSGNQVQTKKMLLLK